MEIISKSAYSHVCHVADLLFKTADVGKKEGGCSPHPSARARVSPCVTDGHGGECARARARAPTRARVCVRQCLTVSVCARARVRVTPPACVTPCVRARARARVRVPVCMCRWCVRGVCVCVCV